jgi:acetyl esterase/lipase
VSSRDSDQGASYRPDATLRYADHDDAVIDVHLPAEETDRLLVFLHGGFWKAKYDRRHTRPLARALAEEGWTVATPEYRRVGTGGGWPTTANDIRTAMQTLPNLLAGIGKPATRTVVSGHSAGGHLALWLASEEFAIDRVVALAPVADLREAARLGLGGSATQAFMGGRPDEVDYRPADPIARLARRPSAEIVVLHGTADDTVPVSISRGLRDAHPWVDVRELDGVGHDEFLEPGSAAWLPLLGALAR